MRRSYLHGRQGQEEDQDPEEERPGGSSFPAGVVGARHVTDAYKDQGDDSKK